MSIFSRWFGAKQAEPNEPESVREIAGRLEGMPPERARFLAAFAYVLARVAHADMHIDGAEISAMEGTIRDHSELSPEETAVAVEIAVVQADVAGATDDYLVVREFRRTSERSERIQLMRCLFAVAAADDSITTAESSELHKIGEELGFMRSEVNALRLEWRDKLSELDSTHSEA
jgi:uncharacterized tellurite resistance protein B-like protein